MFTSKRWTLLVLPLMAATTWACSSPEPTTPTASSPAPAAASPQANSPASPEAATDKETSGAKASPADAQKTADSKAANNGTPAASPATAGSPQAAASPAKSSNRDVVRQAKRQAAHNHAQAKAQHDAPPAKDEEEKLPEPIPTVGSVSGIDSEPIHGIDEPSPSSKRSPSMQVDQKELMPFLKEINECPPQPPENAPKFGPGGHVSPIKGIDSMDSHPTRGVAPMETRPIEGVKPLQ